MRLSRSLPRPLIGVGLLALAALVMLGLGLLVAPLPFAFDRAVMTAVRGVGPDSIRRAAIDVTALGGGTVLTLVVVAAAGLLLAQRLWLTALILALSTWTGGQVVQLVKASVGRARPDLADRLVPVASASFPSGHAANSAIVYLSLAALASQVVRARGPRAYLFGAAVTLVALIGASRVYLGVHWPSDVIAGWSFGALWALGWWWVASAARTAVGGER